MKFLKKKNLNYAFFLSIKKISIYKPFLFFLSFLYSIVIFFRNLLYDVSFFKAKKLPGYCISVGNISAGGSGKSPFIMFLASHLKKRGLRSVILTRGYKSGVSKKEFVLIKNGRISFLKGKDKKITPDEALMYSYNFPDIPILVSPNRFEAAKFYLKKEAKPDIWILDDGFQHRKISRNLDLVLFDLSLNLDNQLLPFGFLREYFSSLKRSDHVILSHTSKKWKRNQIFKKLLPYLKKDSISASTFTNTWPANTKTGKLIEEKNTPSLLICGISHPERFVQEISRLKIKVSKKIFLGDHETLRFLQKDFLGDSKSIITTEKDYYRDRNLFDTMEKPVFISKLIFSLEDHKIETVLKGVPH